MPLIPEKLASRNDVKSSIACQFWEQPSHSTRSIDGQVWSLPCEPPALNLTGSSGLSRTQQLIAAQALGVPAFPSYDASSQGLVLDRVLAKLGGKRWWTAIGGRVKVQRMWKHGPGVKGKMGSVWDLDNYGVVARGRFQLARRLTLNGVVESRSVTLLHRRVRRRLAAAAETLCQRLGPPSTAEGAAAAAAPANGQLDGPAAAGELGVSSAAAAAAAAELGSPRSVASSVLSPRGGPTSPRSALSPGAVRDGGGLRGAELLRAHGSLKLSLPGHDLTASLGYHQDYVDSNGEYAHVPLAASLDLASQYRPDGLQYRVGLHQVTAPAIEASSKAAARRLRTTLHIQGAVAVEGEAHIWKPAAPAASNAAQPGAAAAAPAGAAAAPGTAPAAGGAVAAQAAGEGVAAPSGKGKPSASTADAGATASAQPQQQQQQQQGEEGEVPAGRVASALASAARADADPELPPRKPRSPRHKRHKAGKHGSAADAEQQEGHEGGIEVAGHDTTKGEHSHSQHHHHHKHHHHKHHHHSAEQQQQQQQQREQQQQEQQQHGSGAKGAAGAHSGAAAASGGAGGAGAAAAASLPQQQQQHGGEGGRNKGAAAAHGEGVQGGGQAVAEAKENGEAHPSGRHAPLESFMKPLEDLLHNVTHPSEAGSGDQHPPRPQQQQQQQQQPDHVPTQAEKLLTISAQTIQSGIKETLHLLEQVKESVGRLTSEVQDGSLQRMSQQLGVPQKEAPRRRPYSVFLSQPHCKLNGSMGCLARMPLPPLRALAPAPWPSPLAEQGAYGPRGSSASLTSLGSTIAQAWEPYLKGTSLRLFASGGISGQLGRFTRPFLDYTAVALRADVGLTSPHVVGLLPDPATLDASDTHRPDKHRAFALEGRGSWHSLSASLAQQVLGPLRARADFRFALDPTNMPQNAGERSTIKGLAQTALSVRPSLLEAVFGFDVVLPGTEGAARLACWWSPHRREAMAELRLF